jgi:hypothetical protein
MYTAYDAIEYLMSSTGGGAQGREHRVLRQGLFHAYRDLVSVRDWKWHQTSEGPYDPGVNCKRLCSIPTITAQENRNGRSQAQPTL